MKVLAALSLVLFSGCTFLQLARSPLEPPEVAYRTVDVLRVDERAAKLQIGLQAKNPNSVGLQNVRLSYTLVHEDRPFLKGNDLLVDLSPNASTLLEVPAEVVYRDALAASRSLLQRAMAGEKTFPVRIDLVVSGNPTLYDSTRSGSLFPFTVNVSRTVDVPIPREQLEKAARDKALEELRRRF
jgi:LEA14-like dessication related protein